MNNYKAICGLLVSTILYAAPAFSSQAASIENLIWEVGLMDAEGVKNLLNQGVDPNQLDSDNNTALIKAIGSKEFLAELQKAGLVGNENILQILLDAGADVDLQTSTGWTALMQAAFLGEKEDAQQLLNADASTDIQNNEGESALIIAARANNPRIVQMLLDAGANVEQENRKGLTALTIAAEQGNTALVKALLARGANPPTAQQWRSALQRGRDLVNQHLGIAQERQQRAQQWLRQTEQTQDIPHDLTRLLGKFANIPE